MAFSNLDQNCWPAPLIAGKSAHLHWPNVALDRLVEKPRLVSRGQTQPVEHDENYESYLINHTLHISVEVG